MTEIVCDTNVLLSALLFPGGPPDKIWKSVIARQIKNSTSPDLLTELKRILLSKMKVLPETTDRLIDLVCRSSGLVYPIERITRIQEDPADNRILECAVTARANYIVTGDRHHLLPMESYEGIKIVSPRDFLEELRLA